MRRIALLHYHLKTGGVTTVLRQQVAALQPHARCLVLTGPTPAAPLPAAHVPIRGLGYDPAQSTRVPPMQVARAVEEAIRDHFKGPCDILHVHNPTLAKNRDLPRILALLQKWGLRLFLQIHDFAEDGRPHVYYRRQAYLRDCHYGVINTRDQALLLACGLRESGVHLLPNMVAGPPDSDPEARPRNQVIYPVRAIRRKNIGEALLLSLFFPDGARLAITQPPTSPADQGAYRNWTAFAGKHGLNATFAAGRGEDFARLCRTARFAVTTAISEGFGFAFLEPWLAGKFLKGRALPDICGDFQARGVDLGHLYTGLQIPRAWIGAARLEKRFTRAIGRGLKAFGREMPPADLRRRLAPILRGETIDLGLLAEDLQQRVLERVLADRGAQGTLRDQNPGLAGLGEADLPQALIDRNRRAVAQHYGQAAYVQRLLGVYERVCHTNVVQAIHKPRLLEAFCQAPFLSLLKWEPHDPAHHI